MSTNSDCVQTNPTRSSTRVNPPAAPPAAADARGTSHTYCAHGSVCAPAATGTTPATPPAPKTKQEWFQHLIKMATPTQPVVTTNPDGTQTRQTLALPYQWDSFS